MHQLSCSGGHPEDMQEHLIPIYQVENRAIAAAANYRDIVYQNVPHL